MSDKLDVVVVDDSRSVLRHLERMIADIEGVSLVGTAGDGASALRLVAEVKPDLVLMDIVMPDMDGLTALRLIRSKAKDLRVGMLSSMGGASSRAEEAFSLGAIQVLGKPIDRGQLEALFEAELEAPRERPEA